MYMKVGFSVDAEISMSHANDGESPNENQIFYVCLFLDV